MPMGLFFYIYILRKNTCKLLPLLHEFKYWRVDRWTLLHGLGPQRVVSHALGGMLTKHLRKNTHTRQRVD
jgi:hypothetical protein